jgi:hypothetical protein
VTVRAYPVSAEWPNRAAPQSPPVETCRAVVRRQWPRTSAWPSAWIGSTTRKGSWELTDARPVNPDPPAWS